MSRRFEIDMDMIEDRADKATPGPWYVGLRGEIRCGDTTRIALPLFDQDATFIAHARTDVHALITEAYRLEAARESAEHERCVLAEANMELRARVARMDRLIRDQQWCGTVHGLTCRWHCGGTPEGGHRANCVIDGPYGRGECFGCGETTDVESYCDACAP